MGEEWVLITTNMKLPLLLPCLIFLLILYMVIRLTALQGTYFSSSLQQNTNLLKENNYDKLNYSNQDSSKVMGGEVQITLKQYEPITTRTATVTAYNTVPAQTDSSPCISASGHNICGRDDVTACPRSIAFGTIIEINRKRYYCYDRLSSKYDNRFDISFDKDVQSAKEWGIKTLEVKIYN